MKKLTIEKLLKEKDEIINSKKTKKTMDLYIKSLDASVTIQELSDIEITESAAFENNGDAYAVFKAMVEPKLSDANLQDNYNCTEPYDIVNKIFKPGEVHFIAQKIIELSGFAENAVTEIKN